MAAAADVHAATFPSRRERYGDAVARLLDLGRDAAAALDRPAAQVTLEAWRPSACRRALQPYDLVLLPTLPITPPGSATPTSEPHAPALTHAAVQLPGAARHHAALRHRRGGMPVGLQVAGHDDDVVLGAALALEASARAAEASARSPTR
jgi:Asp-tRNA(Asn)/Glu-tRNA(Gln) amidotransferase A subunit family amidase